MVRSSTSRTLLSAHPEPRIARIGGEPKMGKGTARIADDGPRYAVEFTFCIGRNAEGVHTDMSKLKDVLLPACALGKSGYTLIEGDAGTDEIGNPEYSATIMKSYYIRSVKEAEIAAEEVKEFLGRVFAQMSQESVLLKFQTIDKKRRQSVATNNQLIEVADLNDIDATYFLPFTYRTDLS